MSEQRRTWQDGGHFVAIPNRGDQVFVKEFGHAEADSRQTLLLLHGFPESSFSFHKVVDGLLGQFDRVVLFDMLGYGASDKPADGYSYSLIEQADVALQVWHELKIEGGHVLSHDMGTSVLTELAARHSTGMLPRWFPVGFHSYTFTNGSMVLEFARLRVMQKLLLTRFGAAIGKATRFKTFRSAVESAHGVGRSKPGALTETDIQDLWDNVRLQNGHHKSHLTIQYLLDRRRFERSRWLPALGQVGRETPVHFCWGDADQVARIEMAHYLKQAVCPTARLSVMPGVGHFCQLGSPGEWLSNVNAFYAEII